MKKVLNLFIVLLTNTAILTIAVFMMHASIESKTANYKIAQSLMRDIPPISSILSNIGVVNYPHTIVKNVDQSVHNDSSTLMFAANTSAYNQN